MRPPLRCRIGWHRWHFVSGDELNAVGQRVHVTRARCAHVECAQAGWLVVDWYPLDLPVERHPRPWLERRNGRRSRA